MPVAAQLEGWLHSRAMAQLAGQRFPPLRRGAHTRKKPESTGSRQARLLGGHAWLRSALARGILVSWKQATRLPCSKTFLLRSAR